MYRTLELTLVQRLGGVGKATLIALVLALGGLAVGCGDKEDDSSSSSSSGGSAQSEGEGDLAIGKVGTEDEMLDSIDSVCGDKPTTVGLAWAFDGNAWRKLAHGMLREYIKGCPNIDKLLYANANLDAQKSISDIDSLVAQGVDVLLVYPDFGPAVLPALRNATARGVKVVPFAVESEALGGEPGEHYVDAVSEHTFNEGRTWAEWMVEALDGKGNVVFIGGTPGSPTSKSEFEGVKDVFAKHPGMKILGNRIYWGKYDVAENQRLMAGLLTRYDKIDGVINDYGGAAVGAIRAFTGANRPLVPFATADQNNLACTWEDLKGSNPKFELGTVSSRNWIVYPALRKGLAAYQGKADPEPSLYNLDIIEDSTGNMADTKPKCDPSLPDDAILSVGLSPGEIRRLLGS